MLVPEVVAGLACSPHKVFVDGTVGHGGHAEALLRASAPDGRLIGLDQDEAAITRARERLTPFGGRVTLIHASFFDLQEVLAAQGMTRVDGILLDLGVSTRQLKDAERGFSFQIDGPLDMRMDRRREVRAADLVNESSAKELEEILRVWGEERWARRIAEAIVRDRKDHPVTRTLQLAEIVTLAIPARYRPRDRHPATKTFQALRIAVNDELTRLEPAIEEAVTLLNPGGRIGVIAFHSLEDRRVKDRFRQLSRGCVCPRSFPVCVCNHLPWIQVMTRRPILPSQEEVARNARARSAKLRIAERLVH